MVAIEIQKVYKYGEDNKAILANGVEVTADEVVVSNGKVISIPGAEVKVGENRFSFSVSNKRYTVRNCPDDIKGESIKDEFITYVEADIK